MTEPDEPNKPTIAKAIVAAVGSLTVALATALTDGNVTQWELILAFLGAVGAGAAVWATSNERKTS
jgi:predicted membrane-bound spermidine synthase